jgi:general secretion pathway protein C
MTRVANWVSRILIVLIGYVAATLALRFVPVDTSVATASVRAPVEVPAVSTPSMTEMANDAARQHIFGVAGAKPKPTVTRTQPETETKLNLALLGIYSAEPANNALAIISANGKPEEVFRVGETIIGGASLAEVRHTEVVINNRGRRETLKLPEKVASTGRNVGAGNLPTGNLPTANNAGNAGAPGEPIQLPESPKEIRDTLARNPAMLNKLVSAVPYRENGRILGYRLTPKQSGALLETYGVFAGDVVTRVNGIALANQKNGIRALRKLVKASSVDLTILRDGVELPINIPLE